MSETAHTEFRESERLDCIRMKQDLQSRIYEATKDMTRAGRGSFKRRAGMRAPVRAPRAAWRMSRQSAERFSRASCMASKRAAKTVTLAAQISANRMELASLPLEKSAARNAAAGMLAKDQFDAVINFVGLR